jgi:hypothetical protein
MSPGTREELLKIRSEDRETPLTSTDVFLGRHNVQRDLVQGTDFLAAELEESHTEVPPLYLAAEAELRLSGAERSADPRERLRLLATALSGAWGNASPHPSALVPLFERSALRWGVSRAGGIGAPGSDRGRLAPGHRARRVGDGTTTGCRPGASGMSRRRGHAPARRAHRRRGLLAVSNRSI